MIWIYTALIGWGILLFVSAHRGSEKFYDTTLKADRQPAWMVPVNLTAILFTIAGVTATIYETGRIYGGWE